jgi:hypothetical protein
MFCFCLLIFNKIGSVKYCNVLAVVPMWMLGHANGEFDGKSTLHFALFDSSLHWIGMFCNGCGWHVL